MEGGKPEVWRWDGGLLKGSVVWTLVILLLADGLDLKFLLEKNVSG